MHKPPRYRETLPSSDTGDCSDFDAADKRAGHVVGHFKAPPSPDTGDNTRHACLAAPARPGIHAVGYRETLPSLDTGDCADSDVADERTGHVVGQCEAPPSPDTGGNTRHACLAAPARPVPHAVGYREALPSSDTGDSSGHAMPMHASQCTTHTGENTTPTNTE